MTMSRIHKTAVELFLLVLAFAGLSASVGSADETPNAIHNLRLSLKSIVQIQSSSSSHDLKENLEVIRLSFLIIGLAENISKPNRELTRVLEDVEDHLGSMVIPYYVQFSDERDEMLRAIMNERTDENTVISAAELNLLHQGRTIGQLISGAEVRIAKKTGMEFTPRPGRVFSQ